MALAKHFCIQDVRASQPAASAEYEGVTFIVEDEGYIIERCDGSAWIPLTTGAAFGVSALAADPGSPVDGDVWIRASGVSPARDLELRIRDGGVSYTIAAITV